MSDNHIMDCFKYDSVSLLKTRLYSTYHTYQIFLDESSMHNVCIAFSLSDIYYVTSKNIDGCNNIIYAIQDIYNHNNIKRSHVETSNFSKNFKIIDVCYANNILHIIVNRYDLIFDIKHTIFLIDTNTNQIIHSISLSSNVYSSLVSFGNIIYCVIVNKQYIFELREICDGQLIKLKTLSKKAGSHVGKFIISGSYPSNKITDLPKILY